MSLTYSCDVFCDRCGVWVHGAMGHKATGLATRALAVAKKAGWSRYTRSVYADLCPACLTENRKEK